ncbi:MAG TPA: sigma-70 family RNA polymerase sigma factor [Gemmataceae bacterium]|jgi:RNA polymerase sigma factor (sigma-70 family)
MCGPASDAGPETTCDDRGEHLRRAIEREHLTLLRRIAVLVYRVCGRLRRDEIAQRVPEVLNEAVQRALKAADRFDPSRSAVAWLMGFALRILQEQRRPGRVVVQSDLGDDNWRQVLEGLCAADADAATIRLDIRQALARLEAKKRRILELHFFEGLDGEELARVVDAPSAGAARVRLTRALQALRKQFGPAGAEVTS